MSGWLEASTADPRSREAFIRAAEILGHHAELRGDFEAQASTIAVSSSSTATASLLAACFSCCGERPDCAKLRNWRHA